MAAAPGIAIGPAWRHQDGGVTGAPLPDLRAAARRTADDLGALATRVRAAGRAAEADILEAQALMALDPTLLDDAEARAAAGGGRADPDSLASAVEAAARALAATLAVIPDPLLAARAADVCDVGARIARIIAGREISLPRRPSIAIADDLPPSVAAELPPGTLLGFAMEGGSPVSHVAILARALGIPAIVAVHGLMAAIDEAQAARGDAQGSESDQPLQLALDGDVGRLILSPSGADLAELETRATERQRSAGAARQLRGRAGRTADGVAVPLLANIRGPEDSARAIEAGAEGVGLFRTEFLFLGRAEAPSEDEQVTAYAAVLEAFGADRPVVIRLADIGGDKPIPYLHLAAEDNPFLGIRGLRLAYQDRSLIRTQVRAIARAGAQAGVTPRLMAPMVSTVEDVTLLKEIVAEAIRSLDAQGTARIEGLRVGIMVEVPSAAWCAPELAGEVDFFSIGSNDLTQYVLAMDRANPWLAAIADPLHPAVLRAILATVEGADLAGIPVAVCGELASDPLGAAVLVGLGVDELSMDAGALDAVRLALSLVTLPELQDLARRAVRARSARDVRAAAAALLDPSDEADQSH